MTVARDIMPQAKTIKLLIVFIAILGMTTAAPAENRCKIPCPCPDDYCPKPLPPKPFLPCCCAADYRPKPLPAPPCRARGTCDDYCPKKLPACLPPLCAPWYTCGPQEACPRCGPVRRP